ncbi:phosphotransferase/anion transporter [Trichococcus palustris]|uniref:Phosphotransferase/anion transporter n=1 Tax=Trichococcus palustris TaxID=140314 RepID=A0A143YT71_9LACT|nr:phosphotransferase/anion transporter [Trichococcus palustris]SFK74630.1 PTS system IIA component, Gat family (TC 4.A.5) [Trichococcus palustris]
MSLDLKINDELVFLNLKCDKNEEVLGLLSEQLYKLGYVKEGYREAVLEREKIYPTGLPSLGHKIAIPHADYNLVNKTTIAIGVLDETVTFQSMENVEQPLDIKIVIMLAISEPHGQIEMLQKIVSIIQDESLTERIATSKSKDEIMNVLEYIL